MCRYTASLTVEDQFFSPGFVRGVTSLPTDFSDANKATFFNFLDNFGSHILFGVTMGSKHGVETELRSTAKQELEREGLTIEAAASASVQLKLFSGEASVQANFAKLTEQKESLDSFTLSERSYQYGPEPGADGFSEAVRSLYYL